MKLVIVIFLSLIFVVTLSADKSFLFNTSSLFKSEITEERDNLYDYNISDSVDNQNYKRAEILYKRLEYDKAIDFYKKAEKDFVRSESWNNLVDCKHKMILCYSNIREFNEVTKLIEEVEDVIAKQLSDNSKIYLEHLSVKGQALFLKGDYEDAKAIAEQSLIVYNNLKEDDISLLSRIYKVLANATTILNDFEKADSLYQLGIETLDGSDHYLDLAAIYNDYCIFFSRTARISKAIDTVSKGIDLIEEKVNKQHPLLTKYYTILADYYSKVKDYDQSDFTFQKWNNLSESIYGKYAPQLVHPYILWGNNHYRRGDYKGAIDKYNKGINIIENQNKPNKHYLAQLYNNISISYSKVKNVHKASQYLDKAINLKKERYGENAPEIASSYANMGLLMQERGDYDEAEYYYKRCIKIREDTFGIKRGDIAGNYYELGLLKMKEKNFPEALKYLQKSIIANVINFNSEELDSLPVDNETVFDDLIFIDAMKDKALIFNNLYKKSNDIKYLKLAYLHNNRVNQVFDDLHNKLGFEGSQLYLLNVAKPYYEFSILTALELYNLTGDQRYELKAYEISEKTKSKILLSAISKAKDNIKFQSKEASEISRLKIEFDHLQKELYKEKIKTQSDETIVKSREDELFAKRDSLDRAINLMKQEDSNYFNLAFNVDAISPSNIQEQIPKNTLIIEYFLSDSNLVTFTLNKQNFTHQHKKIDSIFHFHLGRMKRIITTQPSKDSKSKHELNEFIESADYLYDILIGSIPKSFLLENIIIIPDGELGYLPFELLVKKKENHDRFERYRDLPYLFKSHTIRYEYSTTIMFENSAHSEKSSVKYLGFAPDYPLKDLAYLKKGNPNRNYGALDYNAIEVEEVASLINNSKAFINENASKNTYINFSSKAEILHFAMHGDINNDNPLYSKLVFKKDSTNDNHFLYVYELYNAQLNANLAVLSACNSGSGRLEKGEGIVSISRAFKYAGCPNIITSLWNVNDFSSKKIIVSFFQNIKDGQGKGKALNEARKNFLASVGTEKLLDNYEHPYYWGNFILIGDNEPISLNNRKWIWITALSIFSLAILVLIVKKRV